MVAKHIYSNSTNVYSLQTILVMGAKYTSKVQLLIYNACLVPSSLKHPVKVTNEATLLSTHKGGRSHTWVCFPLLAVASRLTAVHDSHLLKLFMCNPCLRLLLNSSESD